MTDRKKLVCFLLLGFLLALIITWFVGISNIKFFLNDRMVDVLNGLIKSGVIEHENSKVVHEINVRWPWYSILYYAGCLSIFYLLLGSLFSKLNLEKFIKIGLSVPLATSLLFWDPYFPFYLVFFLFGSRKTLRCKT